MKLIWLVLCACAAVVAGTDYSTDAAVQLFRRYVRINTTTNNDLTEAVEFWTELAKEQGVPITKLEFTKGYPLLILKFEGSEPWLPAIMLNSHMDVVPAVESMKLIWLVLCACAAVVAGTDYSTDAAVQLFRRYVRINTTTNNDLTEAVEFWTELAKEQGVPITKLEFTKGYPLLILKFEGSEPWLPAIMLNSHMDVVPAVESEWTHPPFDAYLDDDGVIWGRGTQDMKSVGIQYFEALRRLNANKGTLQRTVYMTLMPDEETGGTHGMIPFVASKDFAALNVTLEMDEGTSYDLALSPVFYQDKSVWQIQVDCYGESGHSSTLKPTNDTAFGKCRNVMNTFLDYRDQEYAKSQKATIFNAGSYTAVNINKINGGIANNVVMSHMSMVIDIRLDTSLNEDEFEAKLREMVATGGKNVTMTFILKDVQSPATKADVTNPFYSAIIRGGAQEDQLIVPIVPPGATDGRQVRVKGIQAFGYSPMPNTELLLHSVDERLSVKTFLKGIDIFVKIIKNLASIPQCAVNSDLSSYNVKTNK